MKDIHGQAILDYYKGERTSKLILHTSYGGPEEMPLEVFFREPEDFSDLENEAISTCYGSILDIGAAAGAHALLMQALGMDITAIDNSPGCHTTLTKSGMEKVICGDYRQHFDKFDTLLLLMNGIGIVGKLVEIPAFLEHCRKVLNPGGQVVFDSSDINYLYDEGLSKPNGYYGEISYQYEYKGQKGDWFDWLYVDGQTLSDIVSEHGLKMEILEKDSNDQYLAKITGF